MTAVNFSLPPGLWVPALLQTLDSLTPLCPGDRSPLSPFPGTGELLGCLSSGHLRFSGRLRERGKEREKKEEEETSILKGVRNGQEAGSGQKDLPGHPTARRSGVMGIYRAEGDPSTHSAGAGPVAFLLAACVCLGWAQTAALQGPRTDSPEGWAGLPPPPSGSPGD